MRISEIFDLDQNQAALDFVDVDVETDTAVFVDPRAIRIQQGKWHDECVGLLQSFFTEILEGISKKNTSRAYSLLAKLSEPNETHLGVSSGPSQGRGLGEVGATRIIESLQRSKAATTNLLADLEDTALFVEGMGPDIVSDITTNVIRGALVGYTQHVCDFYDIPTVENQYAGYVWNEDELQWEQCFQRLPVVDDEIVLLVPKSIVRISLIHDPGKYYRRALAPIHEEMEIDAGSSLVYALKNGARKVNRDELIKKYGNTKADIIEHTMKNPEALKRFREAPGLASTPPLNHTQLSQRTHSDKVDFRALLGTVRAISPGRDGAGLYHRSVRDLLVALFYPFLSNCTTEKPIHESRKRLDINFDNVAVDGFFRWLSLHRHAAEIVVECKNYLEDPKNPELDQIGGRFSPHRTEVGILTCRKIENKELFAKRCRDSAKDNRGYILFLDDDDFEVLIDGYHDEFGKYPLLRERFDFLTS